MFMGRRTIWMAVLFTIVFLQAQANADTTFRCNGHIISVGDYKTEVLEKCGEPKHQEQWEEVQEKEVSQQTGEKEDRLRVSETVKILFHMERWTYDLGTKQFIRYLEFKNGELINITTGDKGSNN